MTKKLLPVWPTSEALVSIKILLFFIIAKGICLRYSKDVAGYSKGEPIHKFLVHGIDDQTNPSSRRMYPSFSVP